MIQTDDKTLLSVRDLKTWFTVRGGGLLGRKKHVRAVDGVSFTVAKGRTLGLVGESGSGKTTVGRTLLGLIPAKSGQVAFDGQDVLSMRGQHLRSLRQRMQIIFQDPYGSLNPRMTIGSIISEPLAVHGVTVRSERLGRAAWLLERVGLSADYINRYPHEFSGGQRQRIGIARALASQPDFIVCDEPVSALDVSIQAQILNLLNDLQDEMGLSYLFIAHNLAVVEHFADEVAVMYLGRIVEIAPRDRLYTSPTHPYTQALLSSVPRMEPHQPSQRIRLEGEVPSPINPPPGCTFHPRCPLTRKIAAELPESQTLLVSGQDKPVRVVARCATESPELKASADDSTHCHACLLRQQ